MLVHFIVRHQFSRYSPYYYYPLIAMLNVKTEQKKNVKIQNVKIILITLIDTHSVYDQPFSRYCTVNVHGKNKKYVKTSKFQSSIISFNSFGRDDPLPPEHTWILVSISDVYFQRRCRLRHLLPYGHMLTITKNSTFEISQFFEQLW